LLIFIDGSIKIINVKTFDTEIRVTRQVSSLSSCRATFLVLCWWRLNHFRVVFVHRQSYLMRCNSLYVPSDKTTVTEYQISREVIWYVNCQFLHCIVIMIFTFMSSEIAVCCWHAHVLLCFTEYKNIVSHEKHHM